MNTFYFSYSSLIPFDSSVDDNRVLLIVIFSFPSKTNLNSSCNHGNKRKIRKPGFLLTLLLYKVRQLKEKVCLDLYLNLPAKLNFFSLLSVQMCLSS